MNLENAKKALSEIVVGDPRAAEFEKISAEVRAALARGATTKQIVAALAPEFEGDSRWLTRAVAGLKRGRRGRPKRAEAAKPTVPTPTPSKRATLSLTPQPPRAA